MSNPIESAPIVPVSPLLLRWFIAYSRRYVRRHFHALRLSREMIPTDVSPGEPLIVFMNHPSWWDPLVALILFEKLLPRRTFWGPIDAAALKRYGILRRLGFFGVELGTALGARQFLRGCAAALAQLGGAVCITAQGHFTDVRQRPVRFAAGLGALLARTKRGTALPLALEPTFWEERAPEFFARFGEPIALGGNPERSTEDWTRLAEEHLAIAQDALAKAAQQRDAAQFDTVLSGAMGIGGVYDGWRRFRAWRRGEKFNPQHSRL